MDQDPPHARSRKISIEFAEKELGASDRLGKDKRVNSGAEVSNHRVTRDDRVEDRESQKERKGQQAPGNVPVAICGPAQRDGRPRNHQSTALAANRIINA